MRFFLFGPRFFGVRPGVSFDPSKPLSSRPRDAVDEKAFVYVIKGEHGRIKVGMTIDLDQRIGNLRTGSAFPIEYAYVREFGSPVDAFAVESKVLDALERYKTHLDWFDVPPAVGRDLIDRYGAALLPSKPGGTIFAAPSFGQMIVRSVLGLIGAVVLLGVIIANWPKGELASNPVVLGGGFALAIFAFMLWPNIYRR